jgi:hypothetical protein
MAGQVIYHLLSADHATRAPWPVVTLVSCLPVVALALGTALAHLLREAADDVADAVTIPHPRRHCSDSGRHRLRGRPRERARCRARTHGHEPGIPVPANGGRTVAAGRARGHAAVSKSKIPERIFAAEIETGELPSLRAIKSRARRGTDRARAIRDQLAEVLQEAPEAA